MKLLRARFKNFFSYGNAFTEIDLTKYSKTVIFGTNGNGKSTINQAITFGLFGKPIKPITKALIVNSINDKACLVEIEFEANNKHYMVRRGIKPNVFEVFEDGILLDQQLVGDYQDYLEEKILKCSFRTFMQTSIISIERYTPFMSLSKADRRNFIEDILDIKVFSVMNTIVKGKVSKANEELRLLESTYNNQKSTAILKKKHIDTIDSIRSTGVANIQLKIEETNDELILVQETLSALTKQVDPLKQKLESIKIKVSEKKSIKEQISLIQREISGIDSNASHMDSLSGKTCHVCTQVVPEEFVSVVLDNAHAQILALQSNLGVQQELLSKYDGVDDEFVNTNNSFYDLTTEIQVKTALIGSLKDQISKYEKEKVKIENLDSTTEAKAELKQLAKEILESKARIDAIKEELEYNKVLLELFKDSGIKSKIIDQYIPIINRLVNEYLQKLDFFVSFHLDSEFNETIKSRHRDKFVYDSFQAGEKQRIDIALMFTFRQLAKMKNSFACNILSMDELFDASTDNAGIQCMIQILCQNEFDDSNIFLISHKSKDELNDVFDGAYSTYKRDGFSQLKDVSNE